MPKISVIMPAYNAEKYIGEAIESILCQTYTDFEFIIVNDCSNDRTEEIILSYNDPRIVYLKNEKNLGVAASLNRGLELAGGEYIARMDADDVSMPERLEKQSVYLAHNRHIGVLGSNIEIFNTNGGVSSGWSSVAPSQMKIDLFFSCGLAHPSVMMRRKEILVLGGYNPEYNGLEDYELWCRVIEKHEITTLPDVLLRYRLHESQVTKNPSAEYRERLHRLKIRQLEQLGISSDGEEAEAYYRFCESQRPETLRDVIALSRFFNLAVKANEQCEFYNPRKLSDTFRSILMQCIARLPKEERPRAVSASDFLSSREITQYLMKQRIKKLIGRK